MLAILDASKPLAVESAGPEEWTISVQVDGLAWVIVRSLPTRNGQPVGSVWMDKEFDLVRSCRPSARSRSPGVGSVWRSLRGGAGRCG